MDACNETGCDYNRDGTCSYARIMNIESRPCPPGEKCGFNPNRYPPERIGSGIPRKPACRLTPEQQAHRWSLYNSGATDAEMARQCGVTQCAIVSWRRQRKLPKNSVQKEAG